MFDGLRNQVASHANGLMWRFGRRVYSRARMDSLGFEIATNGEAELQRRLASLYAGRTWTVIDVGANCGQWSLSLLEAAKLCGAIEGLNLLAVEPVPTTATILRETLVLAEQSHSATVFELAMSSAEGEVSMYVVGEGAGTNSVYSGFLAGAEEVRVSATTLDSFCDLQKIPVVDLVKIDAEGHDYEVLLGAAQGLRSGRWGVVQFEYNHRWIEARRFLRDVFELIEGTSYRFGQITTGSLRYFNSWNPELDRFFEANYILVREDLCEEVGGQNCVWTRSNVPAVTREAPGS